MAALDAGAAMRNDATLLSRRQISVMTTAASTPKKKSRSLLRPPISNNDSTPTRTNM